MTDIAIIPVNLKYELNLILSIRFQLCFPSRKLHLISVCRMSGHAEKIQPTLFSTHSLIGQLA